ncbi:MAG: hypothetical protein IJH34_16885, partial [Romboutsia sp.]|nr:hypothetical protein [Romboutsia sp.]
DYIYNKAPVISGGDSTIDYYKGTLLELPSDISVEDDYDGTINKSQVIIDDDQVDYDVLGKHEITYTVEDSWGRVGTKTGEINVISSIDKNEIGIFTTTDNRYTDDPNDKYKAFSIKFKRETDKNVMIIENKTNDKFNPDVNTNKTFMVIKVHDANGEVIETCELLSGDNAENSSELDKLHELEFDLGGYISIDGIEESTKECVKIVGTVVNQKENYADGIKDLDNIDNVRFKITDFGLESVYNEAPTITINQNVNLDAVKGDDIPYMRGVRLSDDHDKLTSANIEVTWNPDEIPSEEYEPYNDVIKGVAKVGVNTLHYKVTDSWGRTCEAERTINLDNGILGNLILLKSQNMKKMVEFTFAEEDNDAQNNRVTLKLDVLNTTDAVAPGGVSNYYTIRITKPDEEPIEKPWWSESSYDGQFDDLADMKLPYGSTIEFINTGHPDRVSIAGAVRNAREDYSDGVQNPDNLRSIKFMVTDSGLKSVYVEKDNITENQNIMKCLTRCFVILDIRRR